MSRRDSIGTVRTTEGQRLLVARRVDASPEAAWELFTDTTRWDEWGPSVTGVECEDRFIETGTAGHVRTIGGLRVPFRVETCRDRRWTWRVAGIPATGHRVKSVGDGNRNGNENRNKDGNEDDCRIGFEIPLWAAPYVPVCRRALRRMDRLLAVDG